VTSMEDRIIEAREAIATEAIECIATGRSHASTYMRLKGRVAVWEKSKLPRDPIKALRDLMRRHASPDVRPCPFYPRVEALLDELEAERNA